MSYLLAGLLLQLFVSNVLAQDVDVPSFTTDRPGIGDTAYLVPKGYVQFEGGLTYQHDRTGTPSERTTTVSTPNTLLRFGFFDGMELRLLGGEYIYEKTGSENVTNHDHGVSAPVIGTKLQLTEQGPGMPQTAVFFNLTLPYGSNGLHPNEVTPDFKVAGNYALSDQVSWELNLGAAWEDGVDEITGFYTTALGIAITDTFSPFAEFFGNMNGPSIHGFDAGFTYRVLPTVQLDLSGGPALTDEATDWFIAAGISFRLPQLWS
ncbi:MAG: hypothetical protein NPIRA02_12520 [Nitrospirales bacterium]|nr:MAG: hypothetical protein NPIRA02_12520 [Nitrospirales bacterium]